LTLAAYVAVNEALQTLDQRAIAATIDAQPGRVTEETLSELRSVNRSYRALLARCPDQFLTGIVRQRIAESQEWVGRTFDVLDRPDAARAAFELAAHDWEVAADREKARNVRETALRAAHGRVGAIDPEYERLHTALAIAARPSLARAALLVELAELHINAGDDFEAEPLLRQSEDDLETLGLAEIDVNGLAIAMQQTLGGLAEGTLTAGDTPFEQMLGSRLLQIRLCLALGQIERERRPERAAEHLRRARELNAMNIGPTGATDEDEVVAVRAELDLLAVELKLRPRASGELLDRALALEQRARRMGVAPFVAMALYRQSDALLAAGRPRDALGPLADAERVLDGERRHDLLPMILRLRAQGYAALESWRDVSDTCGAGIALVEDRRQIVSGQHFRDSYLRARVDLYGFGALAALALGDGGLALERTELAKARSTVRALGPGGTGNADEVARLSHRLDELRASGADVTELLRRRRVAWDLLLIERLRAGEPPPEFALSAVQARLGADEAVLYHFWLRPDRLLCATIDSTRARFEVRAVAPTKRESLEAFVATLLANPSSPGFVDRVHRFGELVLPEDRTLLTGKRRLLVSPHRILHGLPVHTLSWEGEPLIRSMAVTYVPNLTSLLLDYEQAPPGPLLATGIKDYALPGREWPALEQAPLEAEEVRDLYRERDQDARVLVNGDATEAALEELDLTAFTRLHFAAHGDSVGADVPMESFLCLHDSYLDGLDIARWRVRADVAVLSACCSGQRAVGGRGQAELPGDELFGLQAAFFAAGVRRVVGCLWTVTSAVARRVSLGLHRRLLDGLEPDLALQQSLIEFLDNADLVDRKAHRWGPFFLSAVGRPRAPEVMSDER
jgi:hypothetical protein